MQEIISGCLTVFNTECGHFSLLLLLASFLGGILSSLSPCTLGILPLIISYVAGYGKEKPSKTFVQMVSFVLGLAVIMSIMGALSLLLGRTITALGGDWWVLVVASLLMVLGLNLLGFLDITFPTLVKKMPKGNAQSLFLYPFLLGLVFAFASTPCSTPILVGIIGFASISHNILYAVLLLFLFALGQGIVIILAGVFTSFVKNMRRFSQINEILMRGSGILMILCSIVIYYKVFSQFF